MLFIQQERVNGGKFSRSGHISENQSLLFILSDITSMKLEIASIFLATLSSSIRKENSNKMNESFFHRFESQEFLTRLFRVHDFP